MNFSPSFVPSFAGLRHTAEARAKISVARRGKLKSSGRSRPQTEETRRRISENRRGVSGGPRPHLAMFRNNRKGVVLSEEHRQKIGAAHRGRKNTAATRAKMSFSASRTYHEGRVPPQPKGVEYLTRSGQMYRMRSSWEQQYAVALDFAGLTWFYEPGRLLLSDGRTYLPDFYVVEWKSYVEIKGYRDNGKSQQAQADGYAVRIVRGSEALHEAIESIP